MIGSHRWEGRHASIPIFAQGRLNPCGPIWIATHAPQRPKGNFRWICPFGEVLPLCKRPTFLGRSIAVYTGNDVKRGSFYSMGALTTQTHFPFATVWCGTVTAQNEPTTAHTFRPIWKHNSCFLLSFLGTKAELRINHGPRQDKRYKRCISVRF